MLRPRLSHGQERNGTGHEKNRTAVSGKGVGARQTLGSRGKDMGPCGDTRFLRAERTWYRKGKKEETEV